VKRDVVVVGVSAGGLDAVCLILKGLPKKFGFALIIVQHRSRDSDALCQVLQTCSGLPVQEVVDKEAVETGKVYLAPADYHLLIDDGYFALSVDEPELYSRPSIDLTFESVADGYGARAIGVVLTGANRDGARGLRRIVDRGGLALVQDPDTAEVPVMPESALREVPEAEVISLPALAKRLCEIAPLTEGVGVNQ
jgi:two-component system, chemotaxis family, protein-glutamate methylesterase/glutaminase